jgi:type II secretory pathway pseudopilin PulG
MNRSKCPKCGFVGWSDAEVCKKCGAAISPAPVAAAPSDQNLTAAYSSYNIAPTAQLKTGLATASLVIGILNFLFFGMFVIPIIAGIIISVVALNKINRSPYEYGGKSLAIGGLVTNIVSVVILVPILIIAAIAIPNLLAARRAAYESAAVNSLGQIHTAEVSYQMRKGKGHYGTLAELQSESLIEPELAGGTKRGYHFKVEVGRDGDDGWAGFAVPAEYGSTGVRSFFIDETGILRGEDSHGLDASRFAPPVNFNRDYQGPRPQGRRASRNADDGY